MDVMDISERYDIEDDTVGDIRVRTHKRDIGRHTYSFMSVSSGGHTHVSANRIVHEEAHKISF